MILPYVLSLIDLVKIRLLVSIKLVSSMKLLSFMDQVCPEDIEVVDLLSTVTTMFWL